jgi:hypothetical protein
MQFTEPVELEDLIGLLRSERLQDVATSAPWGGAPAVRGESDRYSHLLWGGYGTLFGSDLLVGRLLAGSPSAGTFQEREDERDGDGGGALFSPRQREVAGDRVGDAESGAGEEDRKNKSEAASAFAFEAVPVPGSAATDAGFLGLLSQQVSGRSGRAKAGEESGPRMELKLYLDGGKGSLTLRVPAKASVLEVIRLAQAREGPVGRLHSDAMRYELRIHEGEGEPDLDFPALDYSMEIGNFVEGDAPEFCLCLKPGLSAEEEAEGPGRDKNVAPLSAPSRPRPQEPEEPELTRTQLAERAYESKRGRGIVLVKIYIPENGSYMTVNITPVEATAGRTYLARQLLSEIQAKHRLPLFTEEYQFLLPEKEQARLGLSSKIVSMKTDLVESKISDLELHRRVYADAPSAAGSGGGAGGAADEHAEAHAGNVPPGELPHRENTRRFGRDRGNSAAIHHEDHVVIRKSPPALRFNPDNFLFNDQTAALYEQWNVVKTNKAGKRQRRVFGVDYHTIYNKTQDKNEVKNRITGLNSMLANQSVKRAARLIDDVLRCDLSRDDPACFEIWWKNLDVPLKYEVQDGPERAAYIVAKVKYIIASRQQARGF